MNKSTDNTHQIKQTFPHDPEQWIYKRAEELITVAMRAKVNTRSRYMTPEDKAIEALELEVFCLKQAIKAFNVLYKKFMENQNG